MKVLKSYLVQLTQVKVNYGGLSREEPDRGSSWCHHIFSSATKWKDLRLKLESKIHKNTIEKKCIKIYICFKFQIIKNSFSKKN